MRSGSLSRVRLPYRGRRPARLIEQVQVIAKDARLAAKVLECTVKVDPETGRLDPVVTIVIELQGSLPRLSQVAVRLERLLAEQTTSLVTTDIFPDELGAKLAGAGFQTIASLVKAGREACAHEAGLDQRETQKVTDWLHLYGLA